MTLEIYLEDELLEKNRRVAHDKFQTINDLLTMNLEKKYSSSSSVQSLKKEYGELLLQFESIYLSAQQRLAENSPNAMNSDIQRAYGIFAASEIMMLSTEQQKKQFHQSYAASVTPVETIFDIDDYTTISSPLKSLNERLKKSFSIADIVSITRIFFNDIRNSSNNYLYHSSRGKYKEFFQSIQLKSRETSIKGIEKSETQIIEIKQDNKIVHNELKDEKYDEFDKQFERPPEIITLENKINRDDIIGNEKAKAKIDEVVHCVMRYNIKAGKNAYMLDGGFPQYILLVGDVGTGKTMIAEYAVGLMQDWGKKLGKEIWPVKMNPYIFNSWRAGSVQTFEYQLKMITECNKPCLLFIDEIDQFLPSKSANGEEYKQEIVYKFKTLSTQSAFKNNGNYIIIGTTNYPNEIERAAMSRFEGGTFLCEGPKTPDDMAKVLIRLFDEGIKLGYVQIKDWNRVGRIACETIRNGRQLRDVSVSLIGDSRTNHLPDNYEDLDIEEQVHEVRQRHGIIKDINLINAIYDSTKKKDDNNYVARKMAENR